MLYKQQRNEYNTVGNSNLFTYQGFIRFLNAGASATTPKSLTLLSLWADPTKYLFPSVKQLPNLSKPCESGT